jgi:hypothetical protein
LAWLTRALWRFLFRARLEERHWFVLEQDREILAALPADARRRESLDQHDAGVIRLRRMMAQKARAQIEFEDARETQAAK